jgi:hypothetical protein
MFGLRGSGRATVNPVVALPHLYLPHYLVVEATRFLQTVRLKSKWEGDSQPDVALPPGINYTNGFQSLLILNSRKNVRLKG